MKMTELSNQILESQLVPNIFLDTPNTSASSCYMNKDVYDNVLRIQKPFVDSEVMMLVEEYLQLRDIFQNLKKLARVDVDLIYLSVNVIKVPKVKEEVDKVQELIQILMNKIKVCGIEIFCVEKIVSEGDAEMLDRQQNASGKEDVDAIKECDVEHGVGHGDDHHENYETSLPFDGNNNVIVDDKLHIETSEKEGNESQQPTQISYIPQHHACHLCDQTFTSKIKFSCHLIISHKNEVHKCKICSREFKKYKYFRRHQRSHDKGDRDSLCSICGQLFKDRRSLVVHLKRHEDKKNGPYKCTVCCKELNSQSGLKSHMKTHINIKSKEFICELCGGVFDSGRRLSSHRQSVHIYEPKDCPICGKKITRGNLKRHIQTHSGVRPYKCPMCHKTFTQSCGLQGHIRTHTKKYPYRCSHCNKGFNVPSLLHMHENRHLGIKPVRCRMFHCNGEKPFKCTVCPRQYVTSIPFALHMLSHVSYKELDHCLLCNDGKSFTSSLEFESHLKSVHLSEKPFKCSVCGESFLTGQRLSNHKAMHTGALTCKECGKSFKSHHGLSCHLKLKHNPDTEPLAFKCDICGKQMSSDGNLKRHRKIHTGLEPCKCPICGYTLASKASLKQHLWTHEKEKQFQCEKCEKGFNDRRNYFSHLKKFHPESAAISC